MKIINYNKNIMGTNTYLVSFDDFSIIIDPTISFDDLPIEYKDNLKAVLLTHGHYDHFTKIDSYKDHNLSFYMHKDAYNKLKTKEFNCSALFRHGFETDLDKEELIFVKEGTNIEFNNVTISIIELFGHTNCSIGYLIDNNLFSGDAFFKGSIGRYDLYSSDINESIKTINKIKSLPNYTIYPGHGDATTVFEEIKNNHYFKAF